MWLCFEGRGRVHGKLPEGELRQKGKSRVSAANPGRTAYGARGLRWLGVYGVVGDTASVVGRVRDGSLLTLLAF